jgi:hypothetical protein
VASVGCCTDGYELYRTTTGIATAKQQKYVTNLTLSMKSKSYERKNIETLYKSIT